MFCKTLGIIFIQSGCIATLNGAVRTTMPKDAWILGTKRSIQIPEFWHASKLILHLHETEPKVFQIPYDSTDYNYEAQEAMSCLRGGKLESEIIPLDESLKIMRIMDAMREQWGLKYPFE